MVDDRSQKLFPIGYPKSPQLWLLGKPKWFWTRCVCVWFIKKMVFPIVDIQISYGYLLFGIIYILLLLLLVIIINYYYYIYIYHNIEYKYGRILWWMQRLEYLHALQSLGMEHFGPGFENVGGVVFSTTNTNELLIETAKQDLIPFHIWNT